MLLYFLLVLGICKSVLGEGSVCDDPSYQVCGFPGDFRFPETETEWNQMCPQFVEHFDCLKDYTRRCERENYSRRKYLHDLRNVADELCQKESELHLRVTRNIGCFNEVLQNDKEACKHYLDEKTRKMLNHIDSIQAEEVVLEDDLWMPYRCLFGSLDKLCFVTKSSDRCGFDARNILLELIGKSGYVEPYCPVAGEERLREFMVLLDLNLLEEIILKEIMGKD